MMKSVQISQGGSLMSVDEKDNNHGITRRGAIKATGFLAAAAVSTLVGDGANTRAVAADQKATDANQTSAETRPTVIQYVMRRLKAHGVTDVFGVPGDFAYPILDGVLDDPDIQWRGNCNELNSGYAADGYARINGLGAMVSTYVAGELSLVNALACAYGEFVPVISLVGMPSRQQQATGEWWHHMIDRHDYNLFVEMQKSVTVAQAVLTPENCVAEFERVLAAVLYHRRPGYLGFPADVAHLPVADTIVPDNIPLANPQSDLAALQQAVNHIVDMMSKAKQACMLPGVVVKRSGLSHLATQLVNASDLPFTTAFQDKSTLDEAHPNFMGMYLGKFANPEVDEFFSNCDLILGLGPVRHYFNTGFLTAEYDVSKTINVQMHEVRVGKAVYANVEMKDVLEALVKRMPKYTGKKGPSKVTPFGEPTGGGSDPIDTGDPFYARFAKFIKPGDIVVGDPGSAAMAATLVNMPEGAEWQCQGIAGSIGFGTPAALGAAVAAPNRRVVMIGGEGAHQLTAMEIGQFYKFGLKPVFIVINNDGYLVERYTCWDPEQAFNDLPKWEYAKLPEAFGCKDWFSVKVTTTAELDAALATINKSERAAYVEVVTDRYSMPPMSKTMFELTRPKFGQNFTWDEWYTEYKKGNNIAARS
jgi:indolepyruvate decarboxylase